MTGLTIYDFLLFPVYLYLIFLIFKKIRNRYKDNKTLYLYFTWGFRIKIFFIVVYTLLSHFMIRGDAVDLYFGEGKHFAQLIIDNPSNINLLFTQGGTTVDNLASDGEKGYLLQESNFMAVKVCVLLCFISFSCFLIINLIIGFIAFLASWQLFLFFLKQYPNLHKEFAFACMAVPTVIFWSSGISKDTICISCLMFLTKAFYDISSEGKHIIRNLAIILISVFLIYTTKSYIAISYLPFFLFFLIISKINQTQNKLFRYALKISIPVLAFAIVVFLISRSQELFEQFSSEKLLETISSKQNAFTAQSANTESGSFFTLGDFDSSIGGLIAMAPKAIVATLFRPFIWESRNLIMLLSSLEAMALMYFTIRLFFRKKGFTTFFSSIFKSALVFYCVGFALLFAIFVGISTFNFGSLVRYKIPCIPFFICGLFIIRERFNEHSKPQL